MATRLWFGAGKPNVSPAHSNAEWDVFLTSASGRSRLTEAPSGSALVAVSGNGTSTLGPRNYEIQQLVADLPLGAQTITGTFFGQAKLSESHVDMDAEQRVRVYVTTADGSAVRGVLLAGANTPSLSEELATTLTNRTLPQGALSPGVSLSSVACQAGDRLVVEVGVRFFKTTTTSTLAQMQVGDPVAAADLPVDSTSTGALRGWVEFSHDIVWAPPVARATTEAAGGAETVAAVRSTPTRFYLPSTAGGPVTPVASNRWQSGPPALEASATTAKTSSALTAVTVADTATNRAAGWNILAARYVSDPLAAQTVAGTWSAVVRGKEAPNGNANGALQLVVRVVSGDGTVERGVVYGGHAAASTIANGALGEEWSTSDFTRVMSDLSGTPVSAQSGDRLVIELGHYVTHTGGAVYSFTITAGDTGTDYARQTNSGAAQSPWVETDQSLEFASAGAGAHTREAVDSAGATDAVTLTPSAGAGAHTREAVDSAGATDAVTLTPSAGAGGATHTVTVADTSGAFDYAAAAVFLEDAGTARVDDDVRVEGLLYLDVVPADPPTPLSALPTPTQAPTVDLILLEAGRLGPGTYAYCYAVYQVDASHATPPSPATTITLPELARVRVTCPALDGAHGYVIYRRAPGEATFRRIAVT